MATQRNRQTNVQESLSALDLLEADHREVEGFFKEYEALSEESEKESLALKICLALEIHTHIEEELFYPEARNAIEATELIDEALVEHASAKRLIAEIEAMEVGDSLRDAKVKVLGEQVTHHVGEEEQELFPAVKKSGLDLQRLGEQLAERKAVLVQELVREGEID